jgi:AraC-like DNA-binding protein
MLRLDYAPPSSDLADLFSVFYYAELSPDEGAVPERAAIAQLRILMGGPAVATIAGRDTCLDPGVYMFGPTTQGLSYRAVRAPVRIMGVGVLPAGWVALVNADASSYTNLAANVFDMPLRIDISECCAMPDIADVHEGAAMMSDMLRPATAHRDFAVIAFTQIVDDWLMASMSPDIDDLIAPTGLSPRQLERLCKHCFGMPPKMLARKYRALRAARALHGSGKEDQAGIVSAFYDQSHMIREIKHFAGQTPGEIRLSRAETDHLIDQRRAMAGKISRLVSEI